MPAVTRVVAPKIFVVNDPNGNSTLVRAKTKAGAVRFLARQLTAEVPSQDRLMALAAEGKRPLEAAETDAEAGAGEDAVGNGGEVLAAA